MLHDNKNAGGFALQQYNKAIRLLLEPALEESEQEVDVALITCILFICFEVTFVLGWDVLSSTA